MQLDPRLASGQFWMCAEHFAIEQKGNVCVEFLLQLMQPLVRSIPRPVFFHYQQDLAGFFIDREEIDHCRIRHPGKLDRLFCIRISFHRRETFRRGAQTSTASALDSASA